MEYRIRGGQAGRNGEAKENAGLRVEKAAVHMVGRGFVMGFSRVVD